MYQYLGSTELLLYDFLNILSFFVMLVFNFSQLSRKKKLLSKYTLQAVDHLKKTNIKLLSNINFWAVIEIFLITLVQFFPTSFLNRKFGNFVGTGSNYFGFAFFLPIILFILFYIISVDPFKQMDLITPAFPLTLILTKLACFCQGCCNGIECSFGLYNNKTGLVEFPVQLVEAGLALLIFIFLMLWRKKAKEGTLFPTYLIIYCATRFFSEFLKSDPDVIWKLKTYHILCIIGIIVGIAELIIVLKLGNRIREFYDNKNIVRCFSAISDEISFRYIKTKKKMKKNEKSAVQHSKKKKKKRK